MQKKAFKKGLQIYVGFSFDCKKEKVILKGSLGNTTRAEFSDFVKTNFEIEVDKEILKKHPSQKARSKTVKQKI